MTGTWLLLGLVVVLLAVSAFFVAAEFSLIAARRSVIEPMAVTSSRARSTIKAMEAVSLMMACAQLGITLCGVLLGAVGEPAVATLLEPVFEAVGVPESWLHPVSLTIALLLVVSAHVALGEMVPKNIAIAGPERTAIALAPILRGIASAIGPVIRLLNHWSNAVVRATGREPKDEIASAFTREEVGDLVSQSLAEGVLDADEGQRINSALEFDVSQVDSVMVRRGSGVGAGRGVRRRARTGLRPNGFLPLPGPAGGRPVLRVPAHPRRGRHPRRAPGRARPTAADPGTAVGVAGHRSAVRAGPDAPHRRTPGRGSRPGRGRRAGCRCHAGNSER
jgi:Hemolysins and related proteins containing CBS domains